MATANDTRLCSVDGCERKTSSRGMCDMHYRRVRATGSPFRLCVTCGASMDGKPRKAIYCDDACAVCSVDGCKKKAHSKLMCHMHEMRFRQHGTPYRKCETCGDEMPEDFGLAKYCGAMCRPRCKVDRCEEPYRSTDGYCGRHKALVRRNGKPEGKHEWVPKSEEYTCLVCGTSFVEAEGRRKCCSNNCQQLYSTYKGNVPSLDFDCVLCGKHFKRNRKDALYQRGDKKLCDPCRVAKGKRHGSSAGELARRDGTDCGICGRPVDMDLVHPARMRGSVDHIIPVARGGAVSDPTNLQLAHLQCNVTKQARLDYQPA